MVINIGSSLSASSIGFLIFPIFVKLVLLIVSEIGDYCQTPRREMGECKVISSCQVLFSILKNRPIKPQDADYLRRSQCGFEGSLPKVCCPLGGSEGSSSSSASNESKLDGYNMSQ